MPQSEQAAISPDTTLTRPFWPGPVRVIRVEPVGAGVVDARFGVDSFSVQ